MKRTAKPSITAQCRVCGMAMGEGALGTHSLKECDARRKQRERTKAEVPLGFRVVKDKERRMKVRGRSVYLSVVRRHRKARWCCRGTA